MNRIRVILISSVSPEPTSGGQILLHRHLVDDPHIELQVMPVEPKRRSPRTLARKVLGKLAQSGLSKYANNLNTLWAGRWLDPELADPLNDGIPNVVVTVAHGELGMTAARYARRHGLPLVTFFHDWWPDMVACHGAFRSIAEKNFRALYRESDLALCVSEGMREELGDHPNALILHPIPDLPPSRALLDDWEQDPASPFRVSYFGNLSDYGVMLGELLEATLDVPELLIQVRGRNPNWSMKTRQQMKDNGRWLDFAPREELQGWLVSADAFLVAMVFDPCSRRRMETSFPSKLVEFAQFEKPLILWGPEYSSASKGDYVLHVTDPNPQALGNALERLAASPEEHARLSAAAREAAATIFDPKAIQSQFVIALQKLGEPS